MQRERERHRDKQRERQTCRERERERERHRDKERERERDIETNRERERQTDMQKERDIETDRERETDRQTCRKRETLRQTERERQTDMQRERERERETCKTFQESWIIISTLLLRHDTPPQINYSINAEISRGCSALPNVHLAHHHHIDLQHLYDGLHLHKDGVCIFAKTLKDAALGRSPASPRHLLPTPQYHRPIHPYMPRHPPPAPVRTNTTRHPPHPPKTPYTPVTLQLPTSHPPAAHQTPVRKKKPRATPLQEKPPQPRAQSHAEAAPPHLPANWARSERCCRHCATSSSTDKGNIHKQCTKIEQKTNK